MNFPYFISTDKKLLDRRWVRETIKAQSWGEKLTDDQIASAIKNSLCFGLYRRHPGGNVQFGFARVISDSATFSSVMDVVIAADFRMRGYGTELMRTVVNHPAISKTVCIIGATTPLFFRRFDFYQLGGGVMKRLPVINGP